MGTITAGNILTAVSKVLFDESNTRWPTAHLLAALNEAQRVVTSFDERAATVVGVAVLEVGAAKQTLPATGRVIKDMPRNLSAVPPTPVVPFDPDNWLLVTSDLTWIGSPPGPYDINYIPNYGGPPGEADALGGWNVGIRPSALTFDITPTNTFAVLVDAYDTSASLIGSVSPVLTGGVSNVFSVPLTFTTNDFNNFTIFTTDDTNTMVINSITVV